MRRDEYEPSVVALWNDHGVSEIAEIVGISQRTVYACAKRNGLPLNGDRPVDKVLELLEREFPGQQWEFVPGFEQKYLVSNLGNIFALAKKTSRGGMLRPSVTAGYLRVVLSKDGARKNVLVHRAVLEAFIGPAPVGWQAAHLNGDQLDNRLENLKWCSPKENTDHKNAHGTMVRGSMMYNSKLTEADVVEMRRRYRNGESPSDLYADYGISKSCGQNILYGRSWRHV